MAIDVTSTIEIARPREAVASVVENPSKDHLWIRALKRPAELLTAGPYGMGSKVRRVASMMGRPIDYTTEVVGYEPGSSVIMRTVEGSLPMLVTYSLVGSGGTTRVSVRNQGGQGWMFKVFGPLIARMVKSRVDGDLRALKALVESDGVPAGGVDR